MTQKHRSLFTALLSVLLISTPAVSAMENTDREVQERLGKDDYLVIDLSGGPEAESYPVSFLPDVPPGGWTDEYKTTKLVMRLIRAGTFMMGAPEDELGRGGWTEPQREVTLTKNFYLGVFQVTQQQWELVMGDWLWSFGEEPYRHTRPADYVSVYHARENAPDNTEIWPNWPQSTQVHPESFMGMLRAKTGLSTFDLPTSAQWEYACRAGTTTALNSGKNLMDRDVCPNLSELGRYRNNHPAGEYAGGRSSGTERGTAKVGSYLPNAWGLYDMHGNVWEWCLDWSGPPPAETTDPVGPDSGTNRVRRGGAWNRPARRCRSAHGKNSYPWRGDGNYGLRVCMTLP